LDLTGASIGTVVHVAGLAHRTAQNKADADLFYEVNRDGLRHLLCALERSGKLPECFTLISSVAVYGVTEGVLLSETTPRSATDPYGASKREAEDLLNGWAARHGVRVSILRLPLVIGKNAPGNWRRLVKSITANRYCGVGSGSARRSVVLAQDIGPVLPRLARQGGVYHLTDGYHPSLAELEREIAAALLKYRPFRVPLPVARLGARLGDTLNALGMHVPFDSLTLSKVTSTLTFSDHKARADLDWKPSFALEHIGEFLT
jgi:nucleoside-diphosphate-sugar epimerase